MAHAYAALSNAKPSSRRHARSGVRAPVVRIWSWSRCHSAKVLYESGGQLDHVYFPTTSIVSLLYVMENGASAEIAVVGNEGILGISLFMGGETTPSRAVVQSAGFGYRLKRSC